MVKFCGQRQQKLEDDITKLIGKFTKIKIMVSLNVTKILLYSIDVIKQLIFSV